MMNAREEEEEEEEEEEGGEEEEGEEEEDMTRHAILTGPTSRILTRV